MLGLEQFLHQIQQEAQLITINTRIKLVDLHWFILVRQTCLMSLMSMLF